MARNILIVHTSTSMRCILKSKILANLSDIVLSEAATPKEALKSLKKTAFHLVVFAWEALDKDWLDFFRDVKKISTITLAQFLLITQNEEGNHVELANDLGVKNCLIIPCSDELMIETINRICSPTLMRACKRYSIPGAKALIEQAGYVFHANIINISQGGLLCEIEYSEGFQWSEPVMITASFDRIEEGIAATGLYSVLVRFTVLNANATTNTLKRLRIAFIFQKIPQEVRTVLDRVFAAADKLSLDVYDNIE